MRPIERVIALWRLKFLTDEDVIAWADSEILLSENPPQELFDLSLEGPGRCVRRAEFEFPAGPVKLPYATEFALRASAVSLESKDQVLSFIHWCAQSAMGEELELPEVAFGYQVEHLLCDCDKPNEAVRYAQAELPKLLPSLAAVVAPFLEVLPNHSFKRTPNGAA